MNPVFVGGLPRTGTSLITSLLDGHPQLIVCQDELSYFRKFLPQFRRQQTEIDKINFAKQYFLNQFDPENHYYRKYLSHISIDKIHQLFSDELTKRENTEKDIIEAYFIAYGTASNSLTPATLRWVEKTPLVEQYAPTIFRWWEDTKFIHLIRDPRDLLATYNRRAKKRNRPQPSIATVSYVWLKCVNYAIQNEKKFGSDRYLILYYEKFVSNPEIYVKKIVDFLNITENECLLTPTKGGGKVPWRGNSSNRTEFTGISPVSVGKWKSDLHPNDVLLMESLCKSSMEDLGYTLSTAGSAFNFPAQLKLALLRLRAALVDSYY
ncbi:MAG: sulfotransferase [Gemmatimonadetes bacterium]|nr:MAG: sulfotransferase [Gemmatimonadota bacterium]